MERSQDLNVARVRTVTCEQPRHHLDLIFSAVQGRPGDSDVITS